MPKRSLDIDAGVSPTNASQQPDKSQRKVGTCYMDALKILY